MNKIMSSIAELTVSLRNQLEVLLESSKNEDAEKIALEATLKDIGALFLEEDYQIAYKVIGRCVDKVAHIFDEDADSHRTVLLKVCLLLEQFIETHQLGVEPSDQFFSGVLSELEETTDFNDDKIDFSLINLLRTVYQKQILALFHGEDVASVETTLSAVIKDLLEKLPRTIQGEWKALGFYVAQSSQTKDNLNSHNGKRLLALMDHRLSHILQRKRSHNDLLPELVSAVRGIPEGLEWLDDNIKRNNKTYISAGGYSRFASSLKTPLIQLHESLERYYLDESLFEAVEENINFVEKLIPVFQLMGFNRLSQLTKYIATELNRWCNTQTAPDHEEFYEIVNAVWVLESSVSELWEVNDYEIPVRASEIGGWATRHSRHVAYSSFARYFMKLRDDVLADELDFKTLTGKVLRSVHALTYLHVPDTLQASILRNIQNAELTKEVVDEMLLALSYSVSRRASGEMIPVAMIDSALVAFETTFETDEVGGFDELESEISEFDIDFSSLDGTSFNDISLDDNINFDDSFSDMAGVDVSASPQNLEELDRAMESLELDLDLDFESQHSLELNNDGLGMGSLDINFDNLEDSLEDEHDFDLELDTLESLSTDDMGSDEDIHDAPVALQNSGIEIDEMLLEALVDETGDLEDVVKNNLNLEVYSNHNVSELLRVAHTLKANVKIIGLDDLVQNVVNLEGYLTAQSEYSKEFVNQVDQAFNYMFSRIKVFLFDQMLKLSRQNAKNRN